MPNRAAIKAIVYAIVAIFVAPLFVPVAFGSALIVRAVSGARKRKPRLVWGPNPIISNVYWSRAMRQAGYRSTTYTDGFFSRINRRESWDLILGERYGRLPRVLKFYVASVEALYRYDVFFLPFNGFFLGATPLWRLEASLLRLAGKRTVLIPHGSDAYVFNRIRSTPLIHGLMMSYPARARRQRTIGTRVDYWCEHADVVVPGIMGPDGFGRWDVLVPSSFHIDTGEWTPSTRRSMSDGTRGKVVIAHAPNHRGFKGTEFIVDAVHRLKDRGLDVELILFEKVQNSVIRDALARDVDILVDQVICTGHGLNALEGMASGLPVVSNLEDAAYILPFRRWTYFAECPLVSAAPETLVEVLARLVTHPEWRHEIGIAGREYVEKYHGLDAAAYLYGEVIEFAFGRRESLINMYHPLLAPKRATRTNDQAAARRLG